MPSKTPAIVVSNLQPAHTIEFVQRVTRLERVPTKHPWLFPLYRLIDGFCQAQTVIEQSITVLVDGKRVSHDQLVLVDHLGMIARAVEVEMPIAAAPEVSLYELGRQMKQQELAGLVLSIPEPPAFCKTANYG